MNSVRVVSELPDTIVLDVDYEYSHPQSVDGRAFAFAMRDGKILDSYLVQPAGIVPGHGTARIVVSCANRGELLRTTELGILLIVRGTILYWDILPHEKDWSWPDEQPSEAGVVPDVAPAFDPTQTRFLDYRVVADEPDYFAVDVDYQYGGEFGSCLMVSAEMLSMEGLNYSSHPRITWLRVGRGTVRLVLEARRNEGRHSVSDCIRFTAWTSGNRNEPHFQAYVMYHKEWPTSADSSPRQSSPVQANPEPAKVSAPSALCRWAIVATTDVEQSGLADVLATELSQRPGVQLLERAEVEAATRELALSQVAGSGFPNVRLQLGRLLKADALILLAVETVGEDADQRESLRIVISETTCGARLHLDSLEHPIADPQVFTQHVAGMVDRVINQYASGLLRVVAVPPFVSDNISHEYDPLRTRFAHVVESALALYPGTAVLEFDELQAIRRELDWAGGDVAARVVPVFVGGEFHIQRAQGLESIELRVEITHPSGSQTLTWNLPGIDGVVKLLRSELPARIMQLSEDEFKQSLSVEDQVKLLAARADMFVRRGEFLPATALREAALLVDPSNRDQGVTLVEEYVTVAPYRGDLIWAWVPVEVARESFLLRLSLWERGLQVLEDLVHKGVIDRDKAADLGQKAHNAFDHLLSSLRDLANTETPLYDLATAELFSREKARHLEMYRRFVREVVPRMGKLGRRGALQTLAMFDKPIGSDLIELALDYSCREPEGAYAVPYTKADLDHFAHVLIELVEEDLEFPYRITSLLGSMGMNPDYPRDFSNDDYLEFLGKLEASGRPMCRFYSRLGYLLYDYRYGRDGHRLSVDEVVARLDEWDHEVQEYRCFPGSGHSLSRNLLRHLPPLFNHEAPLPPLPPRVVALDPNVTNEIHFEPFSVVTRFRSDRAAKDGGFDGWWDSTNIVGVIPGESGDIVWGRQDIWTLHEAGVLREVFTSDDPGYWLHDVVWDGRHIWAITAENGLFVYDADGQLVAQLTQNDGLPPTDVRAKLVATAPGEIVAVGSHGVRRRGWCATLVIHQGAIKVDVFHEATLARDRIAKEDVKEDDPRVTFVPYWLYRVPDPASNDGFMCLLSCGKDLSLLTTLGVREAYALWLDPRQRRVESASFPFAEDDSGISRHIYHFLDNGNCLLANQTSIRLWISPANRGSEESEVRELYSNEHNKFYGQMFLHEGHVYAPGWQWVRVDARSLEVERGSVKSCVNCLGASCRSNSLRHFRFLL
ncbi:MAG: hypothetical protein GXY55_21690 [Phycisphaerae bacterium]|nr:hypothetical protein [Phycisphaerae bacterium]